MTVNEVQDNIIKEFSTLTDWLDRCEYMIESGRKVQPMQADKRTFENLIQICQSKIWFVKEFDGSKINLYVDSEALIPKGIILLLVRVLSGRTPKEIIEADIYFIDKIGLKPDRVAGLKAMVEDVKKFAEKFVL